MTSAARTGIAPILLTRTEAAEMLGMSPRAFDRIKSTIPVVLGRLYDPEDLRQWRDEQKQLGVSSKGRARKSCKLTSATPANDTVSPQAQTILQRLQSKPRASTPRLYPVGEPKKPRAK